MLGFGKKERAWDDRGLVKTWREEWAGYSNRALDAAGRSERIDHRSLEAQREDAIERGDLAGAVGLDRDPQLHIGRARWAEARTGKHHPRVDRARASGIRYEQRENERRGLAKQLARIHEGIQRLQKEIADRARQIGHGFDWSR